MSDFKDKMYQIRFRLGLRPDPAGGAYSVPQTPELDLRGLLLRGGGGEGKGRGGEGRGKEKGKEGRGKEKGGESVPLALIL